MGSSGPSLPLLYKHYTLYVALITRFTISQPPCTDFPIFLSSNPRPTNLFGYRLPLCLTGRRRGILLRNFGHLGLTLNQNPGAKGGGRERYAKTRCERVSRRNIRKLEKRFRRNFERKESNDNNNNSGDAKSLPVSSVSRREKNYGYTGGRTRV